MSNEFEVYDVDPDYGPDPDADVDTSGFVDSGSVAFALRLALWAYLVTLLVGIRFSFEPVPVVNPNQGRQSARAAEEMAEAASNRQLLMIVNLVALAISLVLFLVWTFVTRRNVTYLGARNLRFGVGGAVGWYFVPICNLWMPYEVLRETFRFSNPQKYGFAMPSIVSIWWSLGVSSIVLGATAGGALAYLAGRGDTGGIAGLLLKLFLVVDILRVAAVLALIFVTSKLEQWQRQKYQLLENL